MAKGAPSTSGSPLLKQIRRRQKPPGWFKRRVWQPFMDFSLLEFIFTRKRKPSPPRSIYINQALPDEFRDKKGKILPSRYFYSNQNVTSKYTLLTFIPRNLLEQFRRVANCFFLFINILQFFPQFSTINPGLVMLPLIVVLAVTGGKDAYEDIKRHQADRAVNNSIIHILAGEGYTNVNPMREKSKTFVRRLPIPRMKSKKAKKREAEAKAKVEANIGSHPDADVPDASQAPRGGDLARTRSQVSTWRDDPEAGDSPKELGWQRQVWEDLRVGDYVKLYDGEQFPADIVVVSTSEEEDVCYIETKNLDGETNLKSRHGVTGLSHINTIEACRDAHLRIDLDVPENNMYKLNGAVVDLDAEGHDGEPSVLPITLETCLLRGCVLKNTAWVIGIVIFTGHDTKIIQNSGATPSKRSRVERQMDPQVWWNLVILAAAAVTCAVVNYFNERRWVNQDTYWILYAGTWGYGIGENGIITFLNALITFQNIVPISLYISIEFVRTVQASYIYFDRATKYVKNGVTTRTLARSWNLSDDLGQIEYVFSDKTGTLTQNAMVFRQCTIGGHVYGTNMPTEGGHVADKPASESGSDEKTLNRFYDAQLEKDLEKHDSEQSRLLHGFFSVLGLCHTVLAAERDGVIEYKAQSPDEAALVQTAADVGFVFRGRDKNILRMSTPFSDEPDEYELLNILEFTSARKRMSVILRKLDDGRIFLLCKGADNVIFEHLVKDDSQAELRQKTDKDLQFFASEGLRTLCLAYRLLDPKEYDTWAKEYHNATVALEDREERIEEVSAKIEGQLVLLGATAIEDKLQDGVPECISDLKRAGIKVWVATGDKLETAVAIGYTTHLLTNETNLIIVREGRHSVKDQLLDALEGFFGEHELAREISRTSIDSRPGLERINTGARSLAGDDNGRRPGGFSLVIEGGALTHAFADTETSDLLLALSTRCNTVICCRVSPLQKAQIVRLIKNNLGVMCLAIGDGANDVSMIQAADVGVGISGEEGLQAVNSSDYAIAQFRYLRRLLFVHGHWSYFRNSSMILNFFYKNMIGVAVLWWFQPFCGFSTTYVLSYTYILFWNVFWTLVPVLSIGLFDQNVDEHTLMAVPELYRYSRASKYFALRRFFYYLAEGVVQAAVVYYFIHYTYVTTSTRGDGWDVYIYEMSTTMAIASVMVANLFTGLNIYTWVAWTYFGIAFGPFLVWVYTAVFSSIKPSSFVTGVYGNQVFLFRSAAFWFGVLYTTLLALLPRYLLRYARQNFFADDIDLMRLVRRYHPEVDMESHPLLGGKLREQNAGKPEGEVGSGAAAHSSDTSGETARGDIPLGAMKSNLGKAEEARPTHQSRASLSSVGSRFGRHTSARGSAVDMSTGLSREASRGFDFTMEEGGVAVQRMQSRLSQTSRRSDQRAVSGGDRTRPPPSKSSLNPFGISRIRERAGSVLHPWTPKKRRGTTATGKSGHTATDDEGAGAGGAGSVPPPVPAVPRSESGGSGMFDVGYSAGGRRGTHASATPSTEADVGGAVSGERRGTADSSASTTPSKKKSKDKDRERTSKSKSKAGEGEEEQYGHGFGIGRVAPPEEPRN